MKLDQDRMKQPLRAGHLLAVSACAFLIGLGSIGCGGAAGDAGGGSAIQGIALPSEVSAVSAKPAMAGAQSAWSALEPETSAYSIAALPEDSDYHAAQVRKFVQVRALDTFSGLADIFDAMRQTHYADHVGGGWYKALVAFRDGGGDGGNQTRLEEWYVDSAMVSDGAGGQVNRVRVKIIENDGGDPRLIRGLLDIRTAPTVNEDGSLADLGEWAIRASFSSLGGAEIAGHFMAEATLIAGGLNQVSVQESFPEDPDGPGPMPETNVGSRGLIVRSPTAGHGVIEFIDFDFCWQPGNDCSVEGPPLREIAFAYNGDYLTIQREGEEPVSFDRNDDHELVHRYGLFDGVTGEKVEKNHRFGFPVRTADGSHGWYGVWQGRHDLWIDGSPAAGGMTVTREDMPDGETPPTYSTVRFDGALTKVDLVPGRVDQLLGVPAEAHVWENVRLRWDAAEQRWDECLGNDGSGGCATRSDFTSRLPTLELGGAADQRWININGCVETGPGAFDCNNFVYITAEPGPGFFEATFDDETGRPESTGVMLEPSEIPDDMELWASLGGRIYIEYTGEFSGPTTQTGWVQKTLTDFDMETWTPSFDPDGDREFLFEVGREYFVNKRGSNLRVRRIAAAGAASDYSVFMEMYEVAAPAGTLADVYPSETILVNAWDPDSGSKFRLNVNEASPNYLLLEYAEVSIQDAQDGRAVGDVADVDMWGLRIEGDDSPVETSTTYNWQYQSPGEQWGGVTYLAEQGVYVLLDAALQFGPIALPTTNDLVQARPEDEWLSYSLSYDGWLQGVPDPWHEMQKIGFDPDGIPAVLAGNVRMENGTVLTETETGHPYAVKALDVGIFLGVVDDMPLGAPDLSPTGDIDLDSDLPTYVAPEMSSSLPSDATLLYVEGVPVS